MIFSYSLDAQFPTSMKTLGHNPNGYEAWMDGDIVEDQSARLTKKTVAGYEKTHVSMEARSPYFKEVDKLLDAIDADSGVKEARFESHFHGERRYAEIDWVRVRWVNHGSKYRAHQGDLEFIVRDKTNTQAEDAIRGLLSKYKEEGIIASLTEEDIAKYKAMRFV